jgi:1,2-diacylglycerol 3-alpha-glucosyltransferase/glucuronosyltransferase
VKILIVSDAWKPQVNGVVRTLVALLRELEKTKHRVTMITPDLFRTFPCPFYPEIRLAVGAGGRIGALIAEAEPDAIHIVTEGPLGLAARRWCLKHGRPFTTAYHTRFPEYLAARMVAPRRLVYALLRRFHAPSQGVMVATESVRRALASHGFANLKPWGRGVDTKLFNPSHRSIEAYDIKRPIFLTVSRVAVEKNLPAFLDLDLPGSKLVVGDGPLLPAMRRRYPGAHFAGAQSGEALVRHYAAADVMVMPSRTETFGLVLLEAMACGVPVAAYPSAGPSDVIGDSGAGVLDEDLAAAARAALAVPRERCVAHAHGFGWEVSIDQFIGHLAWR